MYRPPLIGFFLGIIIDVLLWFCGPLPSDALDALCTISYPVAKIVSWVTGWRFMQEESIMIYAIAIPITIPLIGLLLGLIYLAIRNVTGKSRAIEH